MPVAGMGTNIVSGGGTAILKEIVVQGGDVMRVHGNEGTVLEADLGGGDRRSGPDTLRAGLPNARVFVAGTGIESFTDTEGKFQLVGLDPGVYSVTFTHPYLEPFGYIPEPFEVRCSRLEDACSDRFHGADGCQGSETECAVTWSAPKRSCHSGPKSPSTASWWAG